MKLIGSRSCFCARCAEQQQPKDGTIFAVYGSTSNIFHVDRAIVTSGRHGVGITPHIIMVDKLKGNLTYVVAYCSINGCGIQLQPVQGSDKIDIFYYTDKALKMKLPFADFLALAKQFKNTGYEI